MESIENQTNEDVVITSGFCLNTVDSIQFLQLYNIMYNIVSKFIYQTPYVMNSSKLKITSIENMFIIKRDCNKTMKTKEKNHKKLRGKFKIPNQMAKSKDKTH